MVGIHVCVNFEHEPGEAFFLWLYFAFLGHDRLGSWGYFDKTVQKFLDTECVESRSEEYGGNLSAQIGLFVKFGIDTFDEFEILS